MSQCALKRRTITSAVACVLLLLVSMPSCNVMFVRFEVPATVLAGSVFDVAISGTTSMGTSLGDSVGCALQFPSGFTVESAVVIGASPVPFPPTMNALQFLFTPEPGHVVATFHGRGLQNAETTLRVRLRAGPNVGNFTIKMILAASNGTAWHFDAPQGVSNFAAVTHPNNVRSIAVVANASAAPRWQSASTGISLAGTLDAPVEESSYLVHVADIDGDGRQDILSCRGEEFLVPTPMGTVRYPVPISHRGRILESWNESPLGSAYGTAFEGFDAGDIDGDGDCDFISGTNVALNDGSGQYTLAPATISLPPGFLNVPTYAALAIGDLDGDGSEDVVHVQERIAASRSVGAGVFVPASNGLPTGAVMSQGTGAIRLVDIDGDGDLDIVWAGTSGIVVYSNDGSGNWTTAPPIDVSGFNCRRFALGDVDGDGDLDFVGIGTLTASGVPPSGTPRLYRQAAGIWTYDPASGLIGSGPYKDVALTDVDDDGSIDVVLAAAPTPGAIGTINRGGYMEIWRNAGGGSLARALSLETGLPVAGLGTALTMEVADADADGLEDLVMNLDGRVSVYARVGPVQTSRYGNVNASLGTTPAAILKVNGSVGDLVTRAVDVGATPLVLFLSNVPGAANPARFLVFASSGVPTISTGFDSPIGRFSVTPARFDLANPSLFELADSFDPNSPYALLGGAPPGAWTFVYAPGLPPGLIVTFAAIVEDATASPYPLALTNYVVAY